MRRRFAVLAALVACGAAQSTGSEKPGAGSGGGKPAAPGDDMFEMKVDIKGVQLEPDALGRPGVPKVDPKGQKTPPTGAKLDAQIKKQREAMEKEKDLVVKQADAALLATSLWRKSNEASGADKNQAIVDARQALRDVAQAAGTKVDATTLQLLGSYELMVDPPDWAAAEKAFAAYVNTAGKEKEADYYRAWWVLTLLREYKNDEALAVVKALTPSEKQPELAYAIAWAKWRKGDGAGAMQAILVASKGWGNLANREIVDHDVLLFASRSPMSLADTLAKVGPMFGTAKENQYALLVKLGLEAYLFAGRWADAIAALDKALATMGDKAPVNDVPTIRYREADFTMRLDDPVTVAKYGKASIEALPKCGQKCPPADMETIVEGVNRLGFILHVLYASTNDARYYQPAVDLYEVTIPLMTMATQAKRDEAVKNMNTLKQTFKTMKAGTGNHDAKYIGPLLHFHDQEPQACYEMQLAANPKLAGTLTLDLESDETGVIKGASTEPKAGAADIAAVATCVIDHAKKWKLPTKGRKGATRIKIAYTLAKR